MSCLSWDRDRLTLSEDNCFSINLDPRIALNHLPEFRPLLVVLQTEPGICIDINQFDGTGPVFVELLKSAPRPAFRINLHVRKGKKIDLTISIHYKYSIRRKISVVKSDDCIKNDHGLCKGIIKEIVNSFTITKMCACPCHDSMYHLMTTTTTPRPRAWNFSKVQVQQFDVEVI